MLGTRPNAQCHQHFSLEVFYIHVCNIYFWCVPCLFLVFFKCTNQNKLFIYRLIKLFIKLQVQSEESAVIYCHASCFFSLSFLCVCVCVCLKLLLVRQCTQSKALQRRERYRKQMLRIGCREGQEIQISDHTVQKNYAKNIV